MDNEERTEETRQSVDFRQLREQMFNRAAERYRHRPLRRWLLIETGRNDVVFAGMVVVSLMLLLLLSCAAIQSLKSALEGWHLHRDGIPAQAIVLEVIDRGKDNSARYVYEAATGDGGTESFEQWEGVTGQVHQSLVVGEEVSIVYDPADPSHSRIEGNKTSASDIVVSLAFACLFVPIPAVMIVLALAALGKLMVQWARGQPGRIARR